MNPVRLGVLLDNLTRGNGLAPRLRLEMAAEYWPQVIGPEIARLTKAGPVRHRVLFVRTADPSLAHQLSLMEKEILARYGGLLGGRYLSGLRLQIGEVPAPASPVPAEKTKTRKIDEGLARKIAAWAREVADPVLSSAFLRAARAWAINNAAISQAEAEEAYLRLMTGHHWPTAQEVQAALEAVTPERRTMLQARAADLIRQEIAAMNVACQKQPANPLSLRSALRRLALAGGERIEPETLRRLAAGLGMDWRDTKRQD